MSEREYPVPDFPDYFVREDGTIVSYRKYPEGREMRAREAPRGKYKSKRRKTAVVRMSFPFDDPRYSPRAGKTISVHRCIAAAKYRRWPEPWEDVRHMDGDYTNNHMDNLCIGDRLNNIIDDVATGRIVSTEDQIDLAITRLMNIKEKMEQEKSPSE
jgi:hypothetical protein